MDLLKYIGETTSYEKKEKLERNKPKSWLKSVSAFANGNGGALLFGISDTDELIGLDDYKRDSEIISEAIKTKMDPLPQIRFEHHTENETYFIILYVESGKDTPYYLIDGGNRTAYIRIGSQSVAATSADLKNLVLKGLNKTFDILPTDIHIKDATFNKLRIEYGKRTNKTFEERDLFSFGLVTKDERLTYAGALFADGYLVYQSRVFCTRWDGLTKTGGRMEAIDDNEFEGNILFLLENTLNFIKINTRKMWTKGPVYREEFPDYPERAIGEALVNALIHRDYSVMGSEVHVDIYDDRLEIYSPGGMYDGRIIQNLDPFTISSSRRNPVLADLFGRMDLMERRGSGLKKIIESYEVEKKYKQELKPEFISTSSTFLVILKNLNYVLVNKPENGTENGTENGAENGTENGAKKLSVKDRLDKIVQIMREYPNITIDEISNELAVSRRTIVRDISKLTQAGRIKRKGSFKAGEWVANNQEKL